MYFDYHKFQKGQNSKLMVTLEVDLKYSKQSHMQNLSSICVGKKYGKQRISYILEFYIVKYSYRRFVWFISCFIVIVGGFVHIAVGRIYESVSLSYID